MVKLEANPVFRKQTRVHEENGVEKTVAYIISFVFFFLLSSKYKFKSLQSYARIGMAKEAAEAASQAKDGELLGRLKLTFAQNTAASSIFDTLRDRLSFQGMS